MLALRRSSAAVCRAAVSRLASTEAHAAAAGVPEARPQRLTAQALNPHLLKAEYAVRGLIPQRAAEIVGELAAGSTQYPFKEVIFANIGNPQALNQQPITFHRQVVSLLENLSLLEDRNNFQHVASLYPADVIERARAYRDAGVVIGAYSASQGVPIVRDEVASFLMERDGYRAHSSDVYLTAGASEGISLLMNAIIANPSVGVMIPIPQYPLYSATITLCDGMAIGYYLDEDANWDLNVDELALRLRKAKERGVNVRAVVVINPGNPTGQVLSEEGMRDVIRFCDREGLVLLADEVYQDNIYTEERPFHSFKKVLMSMPECCDTLELASFHSLSKGILGECGRRGGFMELINFDRGVRDQILKRASINLCPNTTAQVMVGLMCRPPQPGDESYPLYAHEAETQLESLKRRAVMLASAFNSMEGISCSEPMGAMYLFPKLQLSAAACEAAEAAGLAPDAFYSLHLLEKTGLCVVPGSGFGQLPDTHHFRCTFLPPEDKMDDLVAVIRAFQEEWVATYGTQ